MVLVSGTKIESNRKPVVKKMAKQPSPDRLVKEELLGEKRPQVKQVTNTALLLEAFGIKES